MGILNKKGQVAIFVIIALVLVAGIFVYFALSGQVVPSIGAGSDFEPEQFLRSCVREAIRDTVDVMVPQGGFVDPSDFKIYNGIKATYLCKNVNYYDPCINQYPLYLNSVKEELENNIRDDVESCIGVFENELDDRGYDYQGGDFSLDATLKPKAVDLVLTRDFSYSKGSESRSFNSFTTTLSSPLYDLAYVAQTITSQEARFCYFEYVGYMNLYPRWDIRKWTMSDSTRIYTIKDKQFEREMNIAIRGCAIPAGF